MQERNRPTIAAIVLILGGIVVAYVATLWVERNAAERAAGPSRGDSEAFDGVEGEVEVERDGKTWTERFNMIQAADDVFQEHGYTVTSHDTWLEHPESGFVFRPRLLDLEPLEEGGVRTATTIEASHPELVPDGLFEYQHSVGDDTQDSIRKGFDDWAQVDLVVLLDTLNEKPETCTALEMSFPAKDDAPERDRRAMLGPVAHFVLEPPAPAEGDPEAEEEHPFCSCCLLTNTLKAFESFLESDGFYGIRLYAARDENGVAMADCRVNGEDWEEGAQALRDYVQKWPPRGVEFRKQYVVLHSIEKPTTVDAQPEQADKPAEGDAEDEAT